MVHGSRDPSAATSTVDHREAVASADVVITAIPGTAVLTTLEEIGEDVLGDRIVMDHSAAFTAQMTMAHPGDSVALPAPAP